MNAAGAEAGLSGDGLGGEEFRTRLREFVQRSLLGSEPDAAVHDDTLLFEEGLLNSIRILDLIAFVELLVHRKIPDAAVRLENFRSVRAIAEAFGPGRAQRSEEAPLRPREHDLSGRAPVERTRKARSERPGAGPTLEELQGWGDLLLLDPATAGLTGAALELSRYFDSTAAGWARDLGAREYQYPGLIPVETLARAGYPASFPHLLMLARPLCDDLSGPGLARGDRAVVVPASEDAVVQEDRKAGPEYALTPAVCYHCYAQLAGHTLEREPAALTAVGRCFRNESAGPEPLARLADFTMREIVVLGSWRQVEETRRALMDKAWTLTEELDLDARLEKAGDPFFTREAEGNRLIQELGALKYELRLTRGRGSVMLAAASFNHHQDFFGRAFRIRRPSGAVAHSGCVALGLERLVLAFLSRHGLDRRSWPEPVSAFCAPET